MIDQQMVRANGVFGFCPANASGDSIELTLENQEHTMLHFLRNEEEKEKDIPNLSLADFIAPKESGRIDYLGGFAVTAGHGVEEFAAEFRKTHDDYHAIMAQALGDRLAEALAELMHKKARDFCGYGRTENLAMKDILREKYRGIRPAPGYPRFPHHPAQL